jgi:hypothetical protein
MPVKTAFDMDDVQLFDYCQRNELLGNPEISSVFGNESSQTDSKRETSVNPSSTKRTSRYTRDRLENANGFHAAAADTSTKFSTCIAKNLIPDKRSAAKNLGAVERKLQSKFPEMGTNFPESTEGTNPECTFVPPGTDPEDTKSTNLRQVPPIRIPIENLRKTHTNRMCADFEVDEIPPVPGNKQDRSGRYKKPVQDSSMYFVRSLNGEGKPLKLCLKRHQNGSHSTFESFALAMGGTCKD